MKLLILALVAAFVSATEAWGTSPPRLIGNISAAYDLLERVIPTSSSHFTLSLVPSCQGIVSADYCYLIKQNGNSVSIQGTTVSEITAGIGFYLREYCNMTIGWDFGGGWNVFLPSPWPTVPIPVAVARSVPYSYYMNVCTHSYSLVWMNATAWQRHIDWTALSGINLVLGMTGQLVFAIINYSYSDLSKLQEKIQYEVLSSYGLSDMDIRTWFNGPAFLTWSRGQNEYGNNIAGPLPMSWINAQYELQIQNLAAYRSLGISNMLPGFQANVPWALSSILNDSNMTRQGDTGWMDSRDPMFQNISDRWMSTMCEAFGCIDHWYQMDGYFDGGTAPWRVQGVGDAFEKSEIYQSKLAAYHKSHADRVAALNLPACQWSSLQADTYLAGCEQNCLSFSSLSEAQAACIADESCGGLTASSPTSPWQLRSSSVPQQSPSGEVSYYITNDAACRPPITPDPGWIQRGAAAYKGLSNTDPQAIWAFQGWAFVSWTSNTQASDLLGFIDAVPRGNFAIVDMSEEGTGQWQQWRNASFWGAPFVWTSLHDFGGTDGMKGDLEQINNLPFEVYGVPNATLWGTGYTPEGIFQNPNYYEFLEGAPFRTGPFADVGAEQVDRAHRRYGLTQFNPLVASAWLNLVNSTYSINVEVQDPTGVPHLPGSMSEFGSDNKTPSALVCMTFNAWQQLVAVANSSVVSTNLEPFRYDLINVGRQVLAELSTPLSIQFADALYSIKAVNLTAVNATGTVYATLLEDIDQLVQTDQAFLLGSWIASARQWGMGYYDCFQDTMPISCPDFYEWNARSQLTTWIPTMASDTVKPSGPDDYASKHWSGLIRDYYGARAWGLLDIGIAAAQANTTVQQSEVDLFLANLAYRFQNDFDTQYPTEPVGDPLQLSLQMLQKYSPYFASCPPSPN